MVANVLINAPLGVGYFDNRRPAGASHAPKIRKESKKPPCGWQKLQKNFSGGRKRLPQGIKKA